MYRCKPFLVLALFIFFGVILNAQKVSEDRTSNYLEVGKPCLNFIFKDVNYYPYKQVSVSEFSGKWLILDCWAKDCIGCVKSFPKIDAIQKKFADKLQFLLVGNISSPGSNKAIRLLYEKCREKYSLQLPIAYDSISSRLNLAEYPYIIVIDPAGVVRGITYHITEEDIAMFIKGEIPKLATAYRRDEKKPTFDYKRPFLMENNGGPDTSFLQRSLLSAWNQSMPYLIPSRVSPGKMFQALGVNLNFLYEYAYTGTFEKGSSPYDEEYGHFYPFPILEINDSSDFRSDVANSKGMFCYSLCLAKPASKEAIMRKMQLDLKNYFGYEAFIEKRLMPVWKLIADDSARERLKTKGKPQSLKNNHFAGFEAVNYPIEFLIRQIYSYNMKQQPPVIDDTGIKGNIDITVDALMTNWEDLGRSLKANGLSLVKIEKEMDVLVIRSGAKIRPF